MDDRTEISRFLMDKLRGSGVSVEADKKRKEYKRLFDGKKSEIKNKRKEIRNRGLRGKELKQAIEEEVEPLARELGMLRKQWLEVLKQSVPSPELGLGSSIDCTELEYRKIIEPLMESASSDDRHVLDILASFCSAGCLLESQNKRKDGKLAPTPFSFISGSGHQDFLDTIRQLFQNVSQNRIEATLFSPWSYDDEGLSLRWDPVEDRRYALMDRDPTASDNKPRTVWMANLLAYRALVLFTSVPTRHGLATVGWAQKDGSEPYFTWPLWSSQLNPDSIRSLLLLSELYQPVPNRKELRVRGVDVTFRSRRIKVGTGANFKINFSPARML